MEIVRSLLDSARGLLQGEPLRVIGYGAAVVIFLVSNASGRLADVPFDTAITLAGAAATTLIGIIESARRIVYSPASVQVIANEAEAALTPVDLD